MPLSEKQLAASRANGAKSKGPVTPEGRRNSSRNNTHHGVLASVVLLQGESRKRFADVANALIEEHKPVTSTEHALVQTMTVAYWRLLRIWALESASVNHEINLQAESMSAEDSDVDPATRAMLAYRALGDTHRDLDLMSRYEHRFDRQYHRALELLNKLRDRKEKNAHAIRTRQAEQNKEPAEKDEPSQNPAEPTI